MSLSNLIIRHRPLRPIAAPSLNASRCQRSVRLTCDTPYGAPKAQRQNAGGEEKNLSPSIKDASVYCRAEHSSASLVLCNATEKSLKHSAGAAPWIRPHDNFGMRATSTREKKN